MTGGRPTKYIKSMAKKAYDVLANGGAVASVCGELGINIDTYYQWKNENSSFYKSEFSERVEMGEIAGEAWREEQLRKAATEKYVGNSNALLYMIKRRDSAIRINIMQKIKSYNIKQKLDAVTEMYVDGIINIDTYEQLLNCIDKHASIMEKAKYEEFEKRLNLLEEQAIEKARQLNAA